MIKIKPFGNYGVQLSRDVDITDIESEKYVNPEIVKRAISMEKDLNLSVLLEDGPKLNFTRSISGEFDETAIKEFKENIKQFMSWLIKQDLPEPQKKCLDEQDGNQSDVFPDKDEIAFVKNLPEPNMLYTKFIIFCKDGSVLGYITPEAFTRMVNAYLEKYGKD